MRFVLRAATIVALAVVFGIAPLALDQCAASCGIARGPSASAPAPTCHHASTAGPRLGRDSASCGHDHRAAFSTLAVATPPLARAMTLAVASTIEPISALTDHPIASLSASPPHDSVPRRLSGSLRI
jgi:hypothetical protein